MNTFSVVGRAVCDCTRDPVGVPVVAAAVGGLVTICAVVVVGFSVGGGVTGNGVGGDVSRTTTGVVVGGGEVAAPCSATYETVGSGVVGGLAVGLRVSGGGSKTGNAGSGGGSSSREPPLGGFKRRFCRFGSKDFLPSWPTGSLRRLVLANTLSL